MTAVAIVLCTLLDGSSPPAAQRTGAEEKTMSFVGKTVVLRFESGLEVKARYRGPSQLTWEALAGPAKGQQGTEETHAVEVAPDVFFISWVEKSGTTVSNVLDLGAMRVTAFVTFESGQGRQGLLDQGTVTEVPH